MQKALIVRTALESTQGVSWSYEVDSADDAPKMPLRDYLARGWQVVQTCPMPSELDACCLVVLQRPDTPQAKPLFDDDSALAGARRQEWLDL